MKRSIRDLVDLKGKKILLRTDFNVPMDKVGRILDQTRITAEIPTIRYLVNQGAKVIICTHLGRPNGYEISLSLWPISLILMKYFPGKVQFSQKTVGDKVKEQIESLPDGSIILLENVRFHKEEMEDDPVFAKELASLADIYVNDAFGCCHRKHASTYGVARLLPNAIGFLVEKELNAIQDAMDHPKRPFVAIFGGFKVEDKIKVLKNMIDIADTILIGGAMAYPFLVAQWIPVGLSPSRPECVAIAEQILKDAQSKGKKIVLPVDHVAYRSDDKKIQAFCN
jgi:phosphoglycerate kinase